MKLTDLLNEDGRIVKGVNTTYDVGPNEIAIQAKKFGNTVDKDGRPPTLSKKVKGKSTNVLFNLGLTEGIQLKFQRGDDFDTLHIKPKNKNRVELRGKPGYESGNYDPQDKLHQVLDNLGKAANFAELMNGELVSINPKHPDGERAKKTAQDILTTEANEIGSSTEIFVDMDGVLADFFTEWGKLMGVDNWWEIQNHFSIEDALQKIRDTDQFWLDLPVTSNAHNLLNLIKDIKGEYSICSSPLPGDPNSEPHKREWIKKHLAFFPPKEIIITHDKAKYAKQPDGTPNILIDDYGVNIQKWEAAGGVGFKHKDHKFERTAKAIKQHMQEPVEERSLTKGEEKEKERIVKGMKKAKGDFKDRYGKDAEAVMYATATKMAKEAFKSGKYTQDQILEILENFADGKKNEAAPATAPLPELRPKNFDQIVARYKTKKPSALAELVKKFAPNILIMIAAAIGLAHLTFLQKFLVKQGINFSRKQMQKAMAQVESIEENFADGKKKGKSRPGRVKRAGASCNGSVTSLRKKAKNASGERAKMYHWCANMKSGRQK